MGRWRSDHRTVPREVHVSGSMPSRADVARSAIATRSSAIAVARMSGTSNSPDHSLHGFVPDVCVGQLRRAEQLGRETCISQAAREVEAEAPEDRGVIPVELWLRRAFGAACSTGTCNGKCPWGAIRDAARRAPYRASACSSVAHTRTSTQASGRSMACRSRRRICRCAGGHVLCDRRTTSTWPRGSAPSPGCTR